MPQVAQRRVKVKLSDAECGEVRFCNVGKPPKSSPLLLLGCTTSCTVVRAPFTHPIGIPSEGIYGLRMLEVYQV